MISDSSSEEDDCIVISEEESEPEEDTANSGMHTNDLYNVPDDQGRVLINVGHPDSEKDVFLAPQIGRIIKPHQVCYRIYQHLYLQKIWLPSPLLERNWIR